MLTYEEQLRSHLDLAFHEAGMHFAEKSAVHQTLREIAKSFDELAIRYAVAGAMAMFAHGFQRFTKDVDLLITRESLNQVADMLESLEYVKPVGTSNKLRDPKTGVLIKFLIAGAFPGDGNPKPVAFPDPAQAAVDIDGIRYVRLNSLVELKLASGISAPHRLKDLADVQELIRVLKLPREFAGQLNSYVQDKFIELWTAVHLAPPEEG
jgi:hypothetical protein